MAVYRKAFSQMVEADTSGIANYTKPLPSPAPAAKNTAYLGTYKNDFSGEVVIIEKNGGLAIVEGPKKITFPMTHWDRDIFTYQTEGENAVGTAGITFTLGPDGNAQRVLVENLNIHGEGIFERLAEKKK